MTANVKQPLESVELSSSFLKPNVPTHDLNAKAKYMTGAYVAQKLAFSCFWRIYMQPLITPFPYQDEERDATQRELERVRLGLLKALSQLPVSIIETCMHTRDPEL